MLTSKVGLGLQELANHLGIAWNTLFKIRVGKASITPMLALALAKAFNTTPQLWLNLQQKYDLWVEENEKTHHSLFLKRVFYFLCIPAE